jgi:hypothetical protein
MSLPRLLTAATLVAVLAAACGTSVPPASPPAPSVSVSGDPSSSPSAGPSDGPTDSAASPDPVGTPEPTATPAGTPVPPMSADEEALMRDLRADVAVDCVPRRTDLPDNARYGIECRPGDPLVERVGVYRYDSPNDAAYAYMTRMAAAGVDVNSGDCQADRAGEGAYVPGDGEGNFEEPGVFNWENSALMPERNGCFLDEFHNANVRLVCDRDYIGVLGGRDDLSDLLDWAWDYPEGYEPGTPDLPGLCIGPAIVSAAP